MTANAFHNISRIESSLWEAADQLRANSKLTSSEYCMPVLGVIFLRHATNRYQAALQAIQADQATGKMPKRPLAKADFIKRRALMLPEAARYDTLLKLPSGSSLGTALVDAMNAIEADFEPLAGQLPRDYDRFENKLLEDLLRSFDSEARRNAKAAVEQLKAAAYLHRQIAWLQDRFPNAEMQDVPGLCKVVTRAGIEAADWSLTPGRYVGVAPAEVDENFDFEQTLRDIHVELADLNREAVELAAKVQENFEELGV
ncbi:MAG: type I restriction-modification system subunit M N-terminal domain-containing protein [Polaromonas sp.]|nr:type I restriction-modification system subunit M N-terminal domain-containing protein [Polaromonas sp.]